MYFRHNKKIFFSFYLCDFSGFKNAVGKIFYKQANYVRQLLVFKRCNKIDAKIRVKDCMEFSPPQKYFLEGLCNNPISDQLANCTYN